MNENHRKVFLRVKQASNGLTTLMDAYNIVFVQESVDFRRGGAKYLFVKMKSGDFERVDEPMDSFGRRWVEALSGDMPVGIL